MQDAVLPVSQTVRVTQNEFCVSRYLCQAGQRCLCGAATPTTLDLSVLDLSQAEDQVQNVRKHHLSIANNSDVEFYFHELLLPAVCRELSQLCYFLMFMQREAEKVL